MLRIVGNDSGAVAKAAIKTKKSRIPCLWRIRGEGRAKRKNPHPLSLEDAGFR